MGWILVEKKLDLLLLLIEDYTYVWERTVLKWWAMAWHKDLNIGKSLVYQRIFIFSKTKLFELFFIFQGDFPSFEIRWKHLFHISNFPNRLVRFANMKRMPIENASEELADAEHNYFWISYEIAEIIGKLLTLETFE